MTGVDCPRDEAATGAPGDPGDAAAAGGPGEAFRRRPGEWLARLCRSLRREGVSCSVADSLAAAEALEHLDPDDGLDLYFGLRASFVSRRAEMPVFDRCFWSLWGGAEGSPSDGEEPDEELGEEASGREAGRQGDSDASPSGALERLRHRTSDGGGREDPAAEEDVGGGAAYSPVEALARRSFASLEGGEVEVLARALDRMLVRLSTRRSRRLRPRARRGKVDVRRSLREALRHDGELIRLARRDRRVDRPRVVLLCDVSGSMERYSRFLVRFLLAAGRERDVETFVFSTRLVRLTPWLSGARRPARGLQALSEEVPGWSGGTRIGESLEEFLEHHGRSRLGQRTVVVILSDGLDRGDVKALERAMRGIQRRARKVVWLNPLMESPEYEPEARGMKAALPFVDDFAPGHSLEALRDLVRLVRL